MKDTTELGAETAVTGASPATPTLPVEGQWHGRVWRLAAPMILANISVPLLGAVDTAVVGHLPEAYYLGAVAVGAVVFTFVYWGFGFLRMGTTGLTAQALGAGDVDEVRASLARAMLIALVLSAGILALQWPLAWIAFQLFEASAEVETLAQSYFAIRIWGAPAALANYALLGWFMGMQRMRAALGLQVFMNALNIVLDLWFVLDLGWGVEGVAAATAISEYSAIVLGAWMLRRMLVPLGGRFVRARILDRSRLKRTLAVNRDIFIRTICLLVGFAYFTALGARMGDAVLAANAVLMNFLSIMAYGLDGFAHAAEALVGGAVGARDRKAFRAAVRVTTIWAALIAGLVVVAYAVLGIVIVAVLTGLPEVRALAGDYLIWAVAYPVVAVWAFQLDGIFIGATSGPDMRNAMIVSLVVFVAATAVLVPLWGNHGLWLSMLIFAGARTLSLGVRLRAVERSVAG